MIVCVHGIRHVLHREESRETQFMQDRASSQSITKHNTKAKTAHGFCNFVALDDTDS